MSSGDFKELRIRGCRDNDGRLLDLHVKGLLNAEGISTELQHAFVELHVAAESVPPFGAALF